MLSIGFWQAAAERAVKTFAQSLLASLAVATTLTGAPWVPALEAAGLATVLSLLTSIVSDKVGGPGPSITSAEVTTPAAADAVEEVADRAIEVEGQSVVKPSIEDVKAASRDPERYIGEHRASGGND